MINENPTKKAFNFKIIVALAFTAITTSLMAANNYGGVLYSTNVLEFPEHAPFDGTVYPFKKVPNWSHIADDKRNALYSSFSDSEIIDAPYYDPRQLQVSSDTLKWGNPVDDTIRNEKITYSTPYLGNYKLDGVEGAGSHPAVDIKIPTGTPIFAIANGTVVTASNQSSGFGNHIVLQHKNFPSLTDANAKTEIFSSYSHLSEVQVSVGDVVKKGQQIGLSGSTGTATTPHLHFQIDNDQAPWHPFWPFTYQDAQAAGLNFFSAIDAGLGKDKAMQTTINPLQYVQTYLIGSPVVAPVTPVVTVAPVVSAAPVASAGTDAAPVTSGNPVVSAGSVASTDTPSANPVFVQTVPVASVPSASPSASAVVSAVPKGKFSDVSSDYKYYEAISALSDKGIIKGYDDETFKPDQAVNRAEALKFILEGISAAIEKGTLPFTDVSPEAWYSGYLFTAYKREIINGNPDGTFRPDNTVNKAEFFKILFNGLTVDINPNVTVAPYEDVQLSDWFLPYISYAKELKLIDPDVKIIEPSRGMTRGEVTDAMYRLMKLVK